MPNAQPTAELVTTLKLMSVGAVATPLLAMLVVGALVVLIALLSARL